ncbi:MAG TPA: L-seryl-tRNA(Sec) selenium transferase [Mycobacteriales bacterium]|nr:L-seryl-tRNA(Sec) selenium transferase [Mycobacteriales bacterium]
MSDGVGVDPRRAVPRTDTVLSDARLVAAAERLGPGIVKAAVVAAQQAARDGAVLPESVADVALANLPAAATSMRPVINATGVIVHTNLGRAPLSPAAVEAMVHAAGYVDVEYDVATGGRSRRGRGALQALAAAVPDAEAVHVVNNGAAALVLAATALGAGREVVVSRGELVEIGDGFRLPDLIQSTGARIREVGTTNRTVLADYEDAVGPQTGFVLKVHPSNFVVAGFTGGVETAQLTDLGVPLVVDIGSGLLTRDPALPDEPDATSTLQAGADLVTASGDKLLGGPQAGVILGRRDLVERLRRHPLARALRVDKMTLAALEATLRGPHPPVHTALHADVEELHRRTQWIADATGGEVVASTGLVGGGGAPAVQLAGWAVALPASDAERLRLGDPCVVGRVERDRCLLDLRCVPPELDDALVAAVLDR